MSAAVIAELLATFGPGAITLITQLITNIENNTTVTPSQWQAMIAGISASTATTEMAKELQAAGITSTSPQYIALIAATKPTA
jgi:hypothetical protein